MKNCRECKRMDVTIAHGRNICQGCRSTLQRDVHTHKAIVEGGETLWAFGSPIERACAEALAELGDMLKTAERVQLEPRVVRAHLGQLKHRAAQHGWSPGNDMRKTTPDGFHVKGVSTYYGADGEVRGQWVKTKNDEDHQIAAVLDAMTHIADAWQGKADPIAMPRDANEDLLCVYPMGDPHLGLYCWSAETGSNHTLQAAERNLVAAVDHLVDLAPPAETGLIANLGDFFHFDNDRGETTLGTRQDVDTRISKVLAVGLRCMRRNIDRGLTKHKRMIVKNVRGNHDSMTALMLSLCLAQYYEREPRVEIDTSPASYLWHRFGKVLLGFAHGDKCKMGDLLGVMAVDRAKDWGETDQRYFYTGHIHHDTVKELPGVTVESFRTLAPKDKWATDKGYRSGQDMKLDIIHKRYGRIQRHIVGIERLIEAQREQA